MGREVRMVPRGWNHPVDNNGRFIPLLKGPFSTRLAEWEEEASHWECGETLDYSKWPKERAYKPRDEKYAGMSFEEYSEACPVASDYMPEFPEGSAIMLMMYENTSEGTPISPAFAAPEELARWLADNNASAFGGMTATYEQWLSTCKSGWAPSAVISNGHMTSGVAALSR